MIYSNTSKMTYYTTTITPPSCTAVNGTLGDGRCDVANNNPQCYYDQVTDIPSLSAQMSPLFHSFFPLTSTLYGTLYDTHYYSFYSTMTGGLLQYHLS